MSNNPKGEMMSLLTDEELAYFNSTLSLENDSAEHNSLSGHTLSVETEIPQVLSHILGRSKLNLQAEVSHY